MYSTLPHTWTLLLLGTLLCSTSAQAAKLYKWVDEAGTVHYTEKPPQDKNTEREVAPLEPETPVPAPAPADNTPLTIPFPIDQERSQRATERCQALLDELQQYTGAGGAAPAIAVSPEMREARITELQAELDKNCR